MIGIQGMITTKHLFTEATTVIREFGIRTYIRAWYYMAKRRLQKRKVTFLDIVYNVDKTII